MQDEAAVEGGLLRALLLDGEGGARPLDWEGVRGWTPEAGPLWVHLDRESPPAQDWLREESGLDEAACDALLADETRPRCSPLQGGFFVSLRGVNLNPGADPEDMVGIRMWIDSARVLSLRRRRVMATGDVQASLEAGAGPHTTADVVVALADHLMERMEPVLEDLGDRVDDLEERAVRGAPEELAGQLADVRREIIALHRHLAPQRDAMTQLNNIHRPPFDQADRELLREATDRLTRHVEELDELRERTRVTHDQLAGRQTELLNRRIFVLALAAAIFLPLSLLTSLLGINVGGIPGAESPWAFAAVCGLLAVLIGLEVWLLRRLGWF